ncbi:ATP synthase subunit I [Limnohabitans sp. DCL3]|uniref:ATP synthase subunit I n=1 Tax=Limnohabitans sp. DCL3 TaxID=3374103 RepID=UPI003A83F65C
MTKIASSSQNGLRDATTVVVDEALEPEFKPLTAEQAQTWRQNHRQASPWRVLWLQSGVGALMALSTAWVTGQTHLAASVAWGALAVVMPGMVFVRALSRQMRRTQPGAALVGLFVWELVKIILTVALLLVAPKVISQLSWLSLVAGFVVTMKVYWLAMALGWMQAKSKPKFF